MDLFLLFLVRMHNITANLTSITTDSIDNISQFRSKIEISTVFEIFIPKINK